MIAGQFSPTDRKILGFLAFILAAGIILNLCRQNNRAVSPGFLLSVLEAPPANFAAARKENLKAAFGPLDLNRARGEELERLPGIGPGLAQRILDYRQKNGAFKTVLELLRVPGIGPKKLAEIKPRVYVAEASEERPAAAKRNVIRQNRRGLSRDVFPPGRFLSSEAESL